MAALVALDEDLTATTTAASTHNIDTVIGEGQPPPPRRPLSPCSTHLPACKRLCCSHSRQPQQQHQQEQHLRGKKLHRQSHRTRLLLHTTATAPVTAQTMQPSHATLPEDGCESAMHTKDPTHMQDRPLLSSRPSLSLATAGLSAMTSANGTTAFPLRSTHSTTSSTSTSTSTSPSRKLSLRPPPLLLPSSASALSSPSSLSLASPISPSFAASRKQRNAKQLSLAVPSLSSTSFSHSRLSGSGLHPQASTSQRPFTPLSPNTTGDSDSLDMSETRSCPPTPRLILEADSSDGPVLDASDRGELKSSLRGDMSMRRRTSVPRLKILSATQGLPTGELQMPPTPSLTRPKTGIPALTVEALVARNREAGAPLNSDSAEAEEDFPYQFGPKEILPGLYLGSEQNAKDPAILQRLGITQVICCAKEVACPWLAEDTVLTEQVSASSSEKASQAGGEPALYSASNAANLPQEPHTETYLTLPPISNLMTSSPTSQPSRSPSPSRPLFLRPTASTPNLKEKQRFRGPLGEPSTRSQAGVAVATVNGEAVISPRTSTRRVSSQHPGYLHRHFDANRTSGRPALDYTKLPWGHDEDNVVEHFDNYEICELIDRARQDGGRCLVHCQLGVSRSATLMIGYCMRQAFLKRDMDVMVDVKSMHDSYSYVRAKSRWVAPNIGLLAQLVQYERALAAETNPDEPVPYSNSAYYDSQLSLPGQDGSRTPDNLSPSSTSESEGDSHLTTPDTGAELLVPEAHRQLKPSRDQSPNFKKPDTTPLSKAETLSPITASLRITRPPQPPGRLVLEKTAFGSAQRKKEHRKTFSADFSRFPLGFTLHHDTSTQ